MIVMPVFASLMAVTAGLGVILASLFDGIQVRAALLALFGAGAAAIVFGIVTSPVPLPAVLWSAVMILGLTMLAVMDGLSRTMPDILTVPMIALGLLHAVVALDQGLVFGAATAFVLVMGFGILRVMPDRWKRWISDEDILLLAGVVAWLGPYMIIDLIVITALLMVAQASSRRNRTPNTSLPLAPSLGFAQVLVWLSGPCF